MLSSHPAPWRWSTVCIGTAEPPFDQPQAEIAPTARPWYTPIDATSTPLVRPYLAAREREEEARLQQVRRDTPWWATYGVDLDARDLHACLGVAS
ncbi:hypothetical protein ACFYRY_28905 [Streptomyces sp. NPDC005263]|uniref:hypothetical protein n=1 Tax=Streptomyces sp. NPDC005263 TaxID=3364711 RepID=UPI00369CE842